ncbi:MAG: hypothetical protein ACPMAQ_06320, partial [Phycisphaerae bacterium]
AKKILDESDDARLFSGKCLVSEPMAAGVRALLYLWNGWIGECNMYGQAADPAERLYLTGLCERQAGRTEAAKRAFQQLAGHALFAPLGADGIQIVGQQAQAAVKRFRDILELNGEWEPFAFIDLYVQAAAGRLDAASEASVRLLQCREFERLFAHCYQGATGEVVALGPVGEARTERRNIPRRSSPPVRRARRAGRSTTREDSARPASRENPAVAQPPPAMARVVCPKCRVIAMFPGSLVGKAVRCLKCGGFFEIPRVPAAASGR